MAEDTSLSTATSPTASTAPEPSPWQSVGRRVRNTRPVTLARYALVLGGFAALLWLANTAWQSLVPFVVGGFMAYAVLPFVNRLDRVMPRWIASLITIIGVLAFVVLFIATLVPLIVQQVMVLINSLPTIDQMQQGTAQINQSLSTLPEPLRVAVRRMLDEAGLSFRTQIDNFIVTLPQVTVQTALGLFNTIGTVLGLLVLPTWLLTVLKDGKQGVREINKLLPAQARLDFWSIVRIVDRSLRAFLQQQVALAFLVGAGMTAVAWGLDRANVVDVKYPLAAGLIIGTLQLVPEIGPIISYIVLAIAGAGHGWPIVLLYFAAFYLINRFSGQFVDARVATRVKAPHVAVMALLAIMLSQIGLVYALLSVPIIVMSRDLFRYAYGRLSDPPRPAGLLPDDPRPIAPPDQQVLIKLRKPLVYRRAARRRPGRPVAPSANASQSAAPQPPTRSGVS
jgi:predicted PurR-regulated permease PerM